MTAQQRCCLKFLFVGVFFFLVFFFPPQLVLHLVGLSVISIWHSLVQKEKKIMVWNQDFIKKKK